MKDLRNTCKLKSGNTEIMRSLAELRLDAMIIIILENRLFDIRRLYHILITCNH
jgi:hypothetical protein